MSALADPRPAEVADAWRDGCRQHWQEFRRDLTHYLIGVLVSVILSPVGGLWLLGLLIGWW
jgi:hypothetical protein